MKIILNPDKELVKEIDKGLEEKNKIWEEILSMCFDK